MSAMTEFLLIMLPILFIIGAVIGYLLATHIHSIAHAAANRIDSIGVASAATLEPPAASPKV